MSVASRQSYCQEYAYHGRCFEEAPSVSRAAELFKEMEALETRCEPVVVDRNLILYGAGDLGRMSRRYFDSIGIPISFVVDKNAETICTDPAWNGVNVLTSSQVSQLDKENSLLAVCISTAPFLPIQQELAREGWTKIVPVYDIVEAYTDRHPLSNGWFAPKFNSLTAGNIQRTLSLWHDDVSRAHHLQFIAWRRLRQEWTFQEAPIDIGNRYFIPQVVGVLNQHERFMDVGAHEGKVITRFSQLTHGKFDYIWAVEPDAASLTTLESALAAVEKQQLGRVAVISQAVSNSVRSACFASGLGYASQLTPLGKEQTEVITIDSLSLTPTLIKLHLEGEELAALEGAMNTIHSTRPIVMSTSYHNSLGLSELPLLLMQNLMGYRFYMRLHGWEGTAAVVYAIPEERHATCD